MQQRSDEWFQARLAKVTASRLIDIMPGQRGYRAARQNYMMELICQKLSGNIEEGYTSEAMQRGIDIEPIARAAYEADKGLFVEECGFIVSETEKGFGASPDGLVGDDGLLEIKCPNTATHLQFLKNGKPKREYILQMHGQMLCTGRKWCDFVSYDDRLPGLEYKCVRIEYDEAPGNEIIKEVSKFLNEMDDELKTIEKMRLTA